MRDQLLNKMIGCRKFKLDQPCVSLNGTFHNISQWENVLSMKCHRLTPALQNRANSSHQRWGNIENCCLLCPPYWKQTEAFPLGSKHFETDQPKRLSVWGQRNSGQINNLSFVLFNLVIKLFSVFSDFSFMFNLMIYPRCIPISGVNHATAREARNADTWLEIKRLANMQTIILPHFWQFKQTFFNNYKIINFKEENNCRFVFHFL